MLEYVVFDLKLYGVNVKVHNISDLIKYLSRPNCRGYKNLIMDAAQGILDGLTFLHSRGVAHRDLNWSNVLVISKNKFNNASNLVVKLCDFEESWENIVQALNCKKTHTTNVFKGICWKRLPTFLCAPKSCFNTHKIISFWPPWIWYSQIVFQILHTFSAKSCPSKIDFFQNKTFHEQ